MPPYKKHFAGRVLAYKNVYLMVFNVFCSVGWFMVLTVGFHHLIYEGYHGMWDSTYRILRRFQAFAILEVTHSAVGFVPTKVGVVLPQVFSRMIALFAVLNRFEESQTSIGFPMLLFAWSLTEVIRYAFYFFALVNYPVPFITFLRYTMFIALYPIGVTGELLCVYAALPVEAKFGTNSITMPNFLNFTFDFYYFIVLFSLMYIPVFPMLYSHMLKQRRKVLGGGLQKKELDSGHQKKE